MGVVNPLSHHVTFLVFLFINCEFARRDLAQLGAVFHCPALLVVAWRKTADQGFFDYDQSLPSLPTSAPTDIVN